MPKRISDRSPIALDIDAVLKRNAALEIAISQFDKRISHANERAAAAERALRSGIEKRSVEKDALVKELRKKIENLTKTNATLRKSNKELQSDLNAMFTPEPLPPITKCALHRWWDWGAL